MELNKEDIPPCFSASRFDDGHILVCFNFEGHHLEAEIFDNGKIEAFYLNRKNDHVWEQEIDLSPKEE